MSTYVVSDLHGAYEPLLGLLEQINFSDGDTLYILGDVIDRGRDGVKILRYVMGRENIHMLLGNHEHMCLRFFEKNPSQTVVRRWNRNSNFFTLQGFDELTEAEREETLAFLHSLPSEVQLDVNNHRYILVHGFIGATEEERVWNRPKADEVALLPQNTTLIIGHTPVCEYVCPGSDEDMYVYSRNLTVRGDHFRIFHAPGFIDIDCCVGYGLSAARIGCLRLEDGAEFYREVEK